ncbi:MAG: hypothetical protein ACRD3P_16250 [Terriglobales bacterium]
MNASIDGIQDILDGLVVPSQNAMPNPTAPQSKAKHIARFMPSSPPLSPPIIPLIPPNSKLDPQR